jgi:3-oxoacyl-[acyl-carrier-protein] synthase III
MTGSKIAGLGIALPKTELTSAQLAQELDVTEDWIVARTGIRSRRIASSEETPTLLGANAALNALTDADVDRSDVDLIICATVTSESRFPATACLIQSELAITAAAYDVNAGCSGFLFALAQADAAVRSGNCRRALVVGTEVLSRITDRNDKKTAVLFGDGAGAAVVEPSTESSVGPFRLYADGSRPELLYVDPRSDLIHMEGREVYRRAIDAMASSVGALLTQHGVAAGDVDLLIAHQANQRILDAVAVRLGLDPAACFSNITRYGNTSAASIPIALYEARAEGRARDGDLVVLTAFGAGFAWGSGFVRLGARPDLEGVGARVGAEHV